MPDLQLAVIDVKPGVAMESQPGRQLDADGILAP
jgi:hypothetical protein